MSRAITYLTHQNGVTVGHGKPRKTAKNTTRSGAVFLRPGPSNRVRRLAPLARWSGLPEVRIGGP